MNKGKISKVQKRFDDAFLETSGANRNPKFRNSEFVRKFGRNSDGQRQKMSDKFGQPVNQASVGGQ